MRIADSTQVNREESLQRVTRTFRVGLAVGVLDLTDGEPFSVYSRAELVYIDGALMFDRNMPERSPRMDFEVGQLDNEYTGGAGQ